MGFPASSDSKESACNVGDLGSVPGLGRSSGGNALQYSCLENPHGQRSLVGYSPWGCKHLGMTEQLSIACIHRLFMPHIVSSLNQLIKVDAIDFLFYKAVT